MYNDTELIPVTTTFCSLLCADESICGGNNGAISIYTMFNIYGVNNLTVTTVDFAGNSVSSALDNNTLVTGEVPTYINTYIYLQITCIFTCTYIHTYAYINTLTNSKMILLTLTFEQLWAMRKSRLIGSLPFQCYFDVRNALNRLNFSDHVHQRSDWSTLVQRLHQLHHSSGPWRQELHQGDHEPSNQLRLQRHLAPSQHHGILLNWKFVVWEVSKVNHLLIRG